MTHMQPTVTESANRNFIRMELLVKLFKIGCTYGNRGHYGDYIHFGSHWPEVKDLLANYREGADYRLSVFDSLINGVWVL